MDEKQIATLEGVLAGAAVAAAAGFARESDETQRKIRIARDDSTKALRELEDLISRGDVLRARMPVVMDFNVGIAIANQPNPLPSVIPSAVALVRPDLAANMATAVANLQWPPKPGVYDERGFIIQVGELTALASALTYEELRAFLLGLIQSKQPTSAQKIQILLAANALSTVLYASNLNGQQYVDAWLRVFNGSGTGTGQDPHHQTSPAPQAVIVGANIASVIPLGKPEIPVYPLAHQNTDYASKWRVTIGNAGNVPAGTVVFQVIFGTMPWLRNGQPYEPVVISSSANFGVSAITPNGFTVNSLVGLGQSTFADVGFSVTVG